MKYFLIVFYCFFFTDTNQAHDCANWYSSISTIVHYRADINNEILQGVFKGILVRHQVIMTTGQKSKIKAAKSRFCVPLTQAGVLDCFCSFFVPGRLECSRLHSHTHFGVLGNFSLFGQFVGNCITSITFSNTQSLQVL